MHLEPYLHLPVSIYERHNSVLYRFPLLLLPLLLLLLLLLLVVAAELLLGKFPDDDVMCDVMSVCDVIKFDCDCMGCGCCCVNGGSEDVDDDEPDGMNWGNDGVLKLIPLERLLALLWLSDMFLLGDDIELVFSVFELGFVVLAVPSADDPDVADDTPGVRYFRGLSSEMYDPAVPSSMVGYVMEVVWDWGCSVISSDVVSQGALGGIDLG